MYELLARVFPHLNEDGARIHCIYIEYWWGWCDWNDLYEWVECDAVELWRISPTNMQTDYYSYNIDLLLFNTCKMCQ